MFTVNQKGKDDIKRPTDVATFNGKNILIPVHNAAKKYDQTNGTFSYEWEVLYATNANLNDSGEWYQKYQNKEIGIPNPDEIEMSWPDIDYNYTFVTSIPVTDTIHISNGQPDVSKEILSEMVSTSWTVPLENIYIGRYVVKLHVTFTPDEVTGEGNFGDTTTAVPVTAKTNDDGYLDLAVIPIHTSIDIEPDF